MRFERVTFSYVSDKPAVAEVDLVIPAGNTVALV